MDIFITIVTILAVLCVVVAFLMMATVPKFEMSESDKRLLKEQKIKDKELLRQQAIKDKELLEQDRKYKEWLLK